MPACRLKTESGGGAGRKGLFTDKSSIYEIHSSPHVVSTHPWSMIRHVHSLRSLRHRYRFRSRHLLVANAATYIGSRPTTADASMVPSNWVAWSLCLSKPSIACVAHANVAVTTILLIAVGLVTSRPRWTSSSVEYSSS